MLSMLWPMWMTTVDQQDYWLPQPSGMFLVLWLWVTSCVRGNQLQGRWKWASWTNVLFFVLVLVERVEVKDVRVPEQLQRAMAAEAEAAREARAKVIAAEGEHKASRALRHATEIIVDNPAALQVTYLYLFRKFIYISVILASLSTNPEQHCSWKQQHFYIPCSSWHHIVYEGQGKAVLCRTHLLQNPPVMKTNQEYQQLNENLIWFLTS